MRKTPIYLDINKHEDKKILEEKLYEVTDHISEKIIGSEAGVITFSKLDEDRILIGESILWGNPVIVGRTMANALRKLSPRERAVCILSFTETIKEIE